jgi:hypothetical protein
VAHTCNSSYSGGRDQEDQGSKPAQANSSQDPIWKKPITKKGWRWLNLYVGPKFKPQYHKEKKKKPEAMSWGLEQRGTLAATGFTLKAVWPCTELQRLTYGKR